MKIADVRAKVKFGLFTSKILSFKREAADHELTILDILEVALHLQRSEYRASDASDRSRNFLVCT